MTTAVEDIPMTIAFINDEMKALKTKITRGKEIYTRMKSVLKGFKKLIPITVNSPVTFVKMEEQVEFIKDLIRDKRDQINSNVMLWMRLNDWKTECLRQVDSS
jgi:hypothetical protein